MFFIKKLLIPLVDSEKGVTFVLSFKEDAQMAESVDALVSNTSGATHPGSTPGLGTMNTSKSEDLEVFLFYPERLVIFGVSGYLVVLGNGFSSLLPIFFPPLLDSPYKHPKINFSDSNCHKLLYLYYICKKFRVCVSSHIT